MSSPVARRLPSSFFWKRLFSLLGIMPIGVYVVLHLYNNSHSLQGQASYDAYLASSHDIPYYPILAWVFVYLPMLTHATYGLVIIKRGRMNNLHYPWFRNLKYMLQRLTGIGLLLFIPAHVYKTKWEPQLKGEVLNYHHMVEGLHEPLTLGVYLLGVTGVAFHLANGIWDFCYTWGITVGPKAQRSMEILSILAFLAFWSLGLNAIRGFFL
ncbi:MAG: hypothetical protein HY650_16310 [Acidobacteria bacterium]|nr:hypothetical protein [Acidobacteriota bacterium]